MISRCGCSAVGLPFIAPFLLPSLLFFLWLQSTEWAAASLQRPNWKGTFLLVEGGRERERRLRGRRRFYHCKKPKVSPAVVEGRSRRRKLPFFGTEPANAEEERARKAKAVLMASEMDFVPAAVVFFSPRLDPTGGPSRGLGEMKQGGGRIFSFFSPTVLLLLLTSPSFPSHLFPLSSFFSPPGT